MKKESKRLQQSKSEFALTGEPIWGKPLVELYGNSRVLIENHQGIKGYSCCEITVYSKLGEILICGSNLNIASMTKYRLVVVGLVQSVSLVSRR
jgi:sporulation protein YqfC